MLISSFCGLKLQTGVARRQPMPMRPGSCEIVQRTAREISPAVSIMGWRYGCESYGWENRGVARLDGGLLSASGGRLSRREESLKEKWHQIMQQFFLKTDFGWDKVAIKQCFRFHFVNTREHCSVCVRAYSICECMYVYTYKYIYTCMCKYILYTQTYKYIYIFQCIYVCVNI